MIRTILTTIILLIISLSSCKKEKFIDEHGNLVPKTVTEDPLLPSIVVNGHKLHAQAYGHKDSTLIVVIHGGPGANFRYMLNCKSLADKGYRVVFYDQVGSGLSERLPKEWYISHGANAINKVFYDELKSLINHYKTHLSQKVVLLTQSWGSMLATGYAGKYPNEVDGLILAEPGGLKWNDIIEYVGNSRSFGLWSEALNDATFLDQFISGKENQHNILDYKTALMVPSGNSLVGDVKPTLDANSAYYKSNRFGAVINTAMFEIGEKYQPDFSEGISNYQQKVLFFYSSNSKVYTDSWAEKITSVYTNKEVVKVQGVGHSGMFDQIDTWSSITENKILEYLKNL